MKISGRKIAIVIVIAGIASVIYGIGIVVGLNMSNSNSNSNNQYNNNKTSLAQLYSAKNDSVEDAPYLYTNTTRDLQPPVTKIDKVLDNDVVLLNHTKENLIVRGNYLKIEFSATDNVKVDHIECSIDYTAFITCQSPMIVYRSGPPSNVTKTIEIRAVDNSSNVEPQPAVFVYKIGEQIKK